MNEPTQICRGFTDDQWTRLETRLHADDEAAWNCAVEVFERRMRERFLAPIGALADADSWSHVPVAAGAPADCSTLPNDNGIRVTVPGFAIVALCCLLIETLQSFRQAASTPTKSSGSCSYPAGPCIRLPSSTTDLFLRFLQLPAFNGEFAEAKVGRSFVRGVRNGILHDAETRGWVIRRNRPAGRIVENHNDGYALNRSQFCRALEEEFRCYLGQLREPTQRDMRQRFLKKMHDVVKEC